ncbi:MAG: helix-turn-helix transcriptional regulator [Eubacteriales bacterium]|nr:helix-turn-helix transcriptional regulator [Eubacteriales bacterium]
MIFLCFLWTGSAYITWLYRLTDVFGGAAADWLSECVGYLFQAAGLLLLALILKRRPQLAENRRFFTYTAVADGIATAIAVLSGAKAAVLVFGLLMNLLHGVIAGLYLTKLSLFIPQQKKGMTFGIAYGMGSIGSWLLSLPMEQSFLHSNYALIAYFVIIALILVLNAAGGHERTLDDVGNSMDFRPPEFALIALVVVLLSVVKGLGFYFPMSESIGGTISLEFTRAFYAVGLIAAGFIGDKNRKYGAICCLAALVFPFISFALGGVPGVSAALWISAYVFFGFFAVYRVILFCDVAAKKIGLMWMAGLGLLFGRMGDAAGAAGGILLKGHDVALICLCAVLFIATVILFFTLYNKLYVPALTREQREEKRLSEFSSRFCLSAREQEVLQLLIKGRSNAEMAGDLYISENTVKFHIKNVLKKTDCKHRTEVAMKFKNF